MANTASENDARASRSCTGTDPIAEAALKKKIRKAVFPVGGLGTRFLPVTKAMPKEMLPVVDKPLIQYAVEEALAAGIEEIIFVTGRGKDAIENFFDLANFLTEQKFIVVRLGNQFPHALANLTIVHDSAFRNVDGPDASGMGLDLEKSFPVDDFAIHPIFLSPPVDFFHPWNFFFIQGHDDLAAKFVLDTVFLAKILHGQFAFAAIDRLEGTGFVINSGMKDAGIMSGLVLGQK